MDNITVKKMLVIWWYFGCCWALDGTHDCVRLCAKVSVHKHLICTYLHAVFHVLYFKLKTIANLSFVWLWKKNYMNWTKKVQKILVNLINKNKMKSCHLKQIWFSKWYKNTTLKTLNMTNLDFLKNHFLFFNIQTSRQPTGTAGGVDEMRWNDHLMVLIPLPVCSSFF